MPVFVSMRHFQQARTVLLLLTAFAVMTGGVARASLPVIAPPSQVEEALASAEDPVVLAMLMASSYCTMEHEEGSDIADPHCAFCVVTTGPAEEVRDVLYAPRAPPAALAPTQQHIPPATPAVAFNGLRAPPLSA